jgi:UDP-xylose:glucoside alpha-1,3-xylosyltransferase
MQVIYVDTDTLWLDDPQWWSTHFSHMNTLNAAFGLAEAASTGTTWYTAGRFTSLRVTLMSFCKQFHTSCPLPLCEHLQHGWHAAPIPHYGERGLNTGVMMASLARMRASNFTADRDDIIAHWGPEYLPLGDQDVLNIYGHKHPEAIYLMPCIFNFRCALLTSTRA